MCNVLEIIDFEAFFRIAKAFYREEKSFASFYPDFCDLKPALKKGKEACLESLNEASLT